MTTDLPDLPTSPLRSKPTDMKFEHARLLIQGKTPQDLLADRIRSDGAIIGSTLKVNAFINHQVDCHLMSVCGHELARRFRGLEVTKVLSCPGSGLMPAQACALHMSIPLVFATDMPPLMRDGGIVYSADLQNSSHQRENYKLHLSSEFIGPGDRLLIIDDVLSRGGVTKCLAELASQAGATVVGAGFMIEKEFEGGRKVVDSTLQLPAQRVQALVRIRSIEHGIVDFVET